MASLGDVQEKMRPHMREHLNLRPPPGVAGVVTNAPGPRADGDLRPSDLVSRLLAATPPYLYSLPHPTSFFFSEMLRSLVAAKTGAGQGSGDAPPPPSRRPRKRTWREAVKQQQQQQQQHGPAGGCPPPGTLHLADKPLELTTPRTASGEDRPPPPPHGPTHTPPPPGALHPPPPLGLGMLPPLGSPPLPPDMLLPPSQPPPPLWYPPPGLYPLPPHQPPYPIDPLHFFIDLRVSGHIKAKEGEALDLKQTKHCSAFSVPLPRSKQAAAPLSPAPSAPSPGPGPNYVLQNLSRIYDDVRPFANRRKEEANNNNNSPNCDPGCNTACDARASDDDNKPIIVDEKASQDDDDPASDEERKRRKKKDIRALLGLELVVDYVSHKRSKKVDGDLSGSDDDDTRGASSVKDQDRVESPARTSPARSPRPSPRRTPPRSPPPARSPLRPASPMFLHQHALSNALGHLQMQHPYQVGRPPMQGHLACPPAPHHFADALNLQVRHQ